MMNFIVRILLSIALRNIVKVTKNYFSIIKFALFLCTGFTGKIYIEKDHFKLFLR